MAFSDGTADFRSDTVTRPTDEMRRAMAQAEVGDDVYSEDPTVNALEERAAELLGKQAAVFTPSGTMGNQLAINLLSRPGTEIICVEKAHVRNYEEGAASLLSGVAFRTVPSDGGGITAADVERLLEESGYHLPRISVLEWENTHNVSGGRVVPLELMQSTSRVARSHGLSVHLDGARLFNAVVASGVAADRYASVADTVQFCFSKGLGAPVGSILCGSADLIVEARYRRRQFGGGMRQAGVLAAAASVALRHREALSDDHALAKTLAEGVAARYPGATDPGSVETNIVIVDEESLPGNNGDLPIALTAKGVRVGSVGPGRLRFVTHRDVDQTDADRVLDVIDSMA